MAYTITDKYRHLSARLFELADLNGVTGLPPIVMSSVEAIIQLREVIPSSIPPNAKEAIDEINHIKQEIPQKMANLSAEVFCKYFSEDELENLVLIFSTPIFQKFNSEVEWVKDLANLCEKEYRPKLLDAASRGKEAMESALRNDVKESIIPIHNPNSERSH